MNLSLFPTTVQASKTNVKCWSK